MLRNSVYKTIRGKKGNFKSMKPKLHSNTTKKYKIKVHELVFWLYSYHRKAAMKFMVSEAINCYEIVFSLTNNLNSCHYWSISLAFLSRTIIHCSTSVQKVKSNIETSKYKVILQEQKSNLVRGCLVLLSNPAVLKILVSGALLKVFGESRLQRTFLFEIYIYINI